jgi:hypothetical protein
MKQKKILSEHLSENDLKWLVDDDVMIDMHKTKLGQDKDYIVLAIAVTDRTPAHDLGRFIENGIYDFSDVEVSPATDEQGRYLIYVEIPRNDESFKVIDGILKDSGKLTGIKNWYFKTIGLDDYTPFEQETFSQYVITDPDIYQQQHRDQKNSDTAVVKESIRSRLKFLLNY